MLRIMVCQFSMGYQHISVTNQNSHAISDSSQHLLFQGKPHTQIEELQNSTLCYRMRHGSTQKLETNSKFLEPQVNLIFYRVQIVMVTPTYPRASLKNVCRKHVETLFKKIIICYLCACVCVCEYMCVCMHACVYMYMHYECAYACICMCIYACVHVCLCMYAHGYVCACMHVHECMYICVCGCMYVCVYQCMYMNVYMYVCI